MKLLKKLPTFYGTYYFPSPFACQGASAVCTAVLREVVPRRVVIMGAAGHFALATTVGGSYVRPTE